MRVLTGGAGRGKTRHAAVLARACGGEWLEGFAGAGEFERFRRGGRTEEWGWDKPVLVLIDYPASRVAALRDWLNEIVDAPMEGRPKLRLLFLERQAQREIGWLAELVGGGGDLALAKDACVAARAAVETLSPYFLRRPLAHAGWTHLMCRQYIARCEKLEQAPDEALLDPIMAALSALQNPITPAST